MRKAGVNLQSISYVEQTAHSYAFTQLLVQAGSAKASTLFPDCLHTHPILFNTHSFLSEC